MRRMGRFAGGTVAALAVLLLAACSGAGQTGCIAPPQPAFTPTPVPMPTLISPASGATGVSTGPLDVTIGNAVGASALYLTKPPAATAADYVNGTNFRQANPPSNDVRTATFAQLASQTTYTVYAFVAVASSNYYNPCGINPLAIVSAQAMPIGSFTTR